MSPCASPLPIGGLGGRMRGRPLATFLPCSATDERSECDECGRPARPRRNSELLDQARQKWPAWVAADPRLGVVEDFDDLRAWLPSVDAESSDEVLLALAMMAAPDGGDDVAAAAALAKCLLPGAYRLAGWLSTLSPKEVFPAQPWHSLETSSDSLFGSRSLLRDRFELSPVAGNRRTNGSAAEQEIS